VGSAGAIRKVRADLEAAGRPADESDLTRRLNEEMQRAVEDVKAGR